MGEAWEPWLCLPQGLCVAVPVRTGCVTMTEGPCAYRQDWPTCH